MRDSHIKAIERKIYRIKTMKRIGKMLIVTVILIAGIITISNLDSTLTTDLTHEKECVEQVIGKAEKVAEIENQNPVATYGISLTPQELDIVCRVVSAEARGESLDGRMAVAQVIRDRAQYWDMSVTEVVTAPSQFAKPRQGRISDETYLAVANVFNGMSVLQEPVTHFYSGEHEPYWTSDKVNRGSIGRHEFYY